MTKILVIDDDETIRDVLQLFLSKEGFEVTVAASAEEGLDILFSEAPDLLLVDMVMPGMGGMDILKVLKQKNINIPVIMITAFGTIESAVEAMKLGAYDYITKPLNLEALVITIKRAVDVSRLRKENLWLKRQLRQRYHFSGLIGDSPKMQKVYEMIEKIADTDSTVLITGESGTGKELVARTIHYSSSRAEGPFVPINCAAIPKDLLETELFGHEKGAFTGAFNTRIGRFELANNGTIFLDEISELAPSLQVKLLRVIQEREFERVGGVKTIKVNVRIIAATNQNLEKAVEEGRFREDLYYRLNVIPLPLPSLRERKEDIPLLINHFVKKFTKKLKRTPLNFPPEVMHCLMQYDWPGNVRELENLIERLMILVSGDKVSISDLPEKFHAFVNPETHYGTTSTFLYDSVEELPEEGVTLNSIIENIEKKLILKALDKTGGNRSKAATLLGLNRTTLIEKMKKMGIDFPRPKKPSSI